MARRVKDIFEISEYTSLDALIECLQAIRANLSAESSPEILIRGDDFFGQRLTVSYLRELTQEEAAMEERYSPAGRGSPLRSARPPTVMRPGRQAALVRRTLG